MQFFLDFAKVRTKFVLIFSLILVCCGFVSCKKEKRPDKLLIGDDFYYWEADLNSNVGDAIRNSAAFKKLEDKSEHNLMHVCKKNKSNCVWVRAEFEIPQPFKGQALGLVIPHLRFAEQVYLNNVFISQYGNFPPHEQSTLFKAHFFSFPLNLLKQDGKNTVLVKVFVQGDSGISSHSFIWPTRFAYPAFENLNFIYSRIYMLFFGIMLITAVLYGSLYIRVKFSEFRDFAIMNVFSALFMFYFFATEIPAYTSGAIPFLPMAKISLCISGYLVIYMATLFALNFYNGKTLFLVKVIRHSIAGLQVLFVILSPTFDFLVMYSPFFIALMFVQVVLGITDLLFHIYKKQTRRNALYLFLGFSPFVIGVLLDVALRFHDNTKVYPYFFIFSWQGAIVLFIIMLSSRFASIYRRNEQLSNNLLSEVAARTRELEDANYELSIINERLEKGKNRSEMDLEMAAVVQRKFLPKPNRNFRGWDIAVCYSPQAKVSGDFYDYYSFNDTLNGITLFDVSGHGLSASLVTMLSKNIISRVFQTGFKRRERVDLLLNKINNLILSEKGDIENYMTGILCRFDDSDNSGKCNVELGNAGHPYPLKYSVSDNEVFEMKSNDGKPHYGAIGMNGIDVSFGRSNFIMSIGDILVLYTDGLTEASNSKQEQFGLEAVKKILKVHHAKTPSEIIGLIMEELDLFTEFRGFEDDLTLIVAKRTNVNEFISEEEPEEFFDDDVEELEAGE